MANPAVSDRSSGDPVVRYALKLWYVMRPPNTRMPALRSTSAVTGSGAMPPGVAVIVAPRGSVRAFDRHPLTSSLGPP